MAAQDHWQADEEALEVYEVELSEVEGDFARQTKLLKMRASRALAILRLKSKVPANTQVEFDGLVFHKIK